MLLKKFSLALGPCCCPPSPATTPKFTGLNQMLRMISDGHGWSIFVKVGPPPPPPPPPHPPTATLIYWPNFSLLARADIETRLQKSDVEQRQASLTPASPSFTWNPDGTGVTPTTLAQKMLHKLIGCNTIPASFLIFFLNFQSSDKLEDECLAQIQHWFKQGAFQRNRLELGNWINLKVKIRQPLTSIALHELCHYWENTFPVYPTANFPVYPTAKLSQNTR